MDLRSEKKMLKKYANDYEQQKWVGLKFGGHLVYNVDFIVIKNIGFKYEFLLLKHVQL
jgi:hypothetical protein